MLPPKSLDHVACWVADREAIAAFLGGPLGLRLIERTEDFTLMGANAREGKITLFDAPGPRERGALERIVFRVRDLESALQTVPGVVARDGETAHFASQGGLSFGLVQRETELDYDLDHVVLALTDPVGSGQALSDLGFRREDDGRLWVEDRYVELIAGTAGEVEQPLLNHLALLVDSAAEHIEHARGLGVTIEEVKDAPNTYAGFVTGPEGVRIEFVEHKPTFSLV